jgi:antitoxin (DNA-binding transcriptional repressor) of toxin-antitoxin stability system
MDYLAIKDLKKTKILREKLKKEREIILTKDGQPFALVVGVSPDAVEESLDEVRRAMFSIAVLRARRRAAKAPAREKEINNEILKSRKNRRSK